MQFCEIELQKRMDKHFKEKSKCVCSLEKNERTNISKNSKMQFGEKTNGQHFEKQTKVVLGKFKYKQTNILKKSKCSF